MAPRHCQRMRHVARVSAQKNPALGSVGLSPCEPKIRAASASTAVKANSGVIDRDHRHQCRKCFLILRYSDHRCHPSIALTKTNAAIRTERPPNNSVSNNSNISFHPRGIHNPGITAASTTIKQARIVDSTPEKDDDYPPPARRSVNTGYPLPVNHT